MQNVTEIPSSSRRWVAIAMMDVVGFTSLTERNEAETLHQWEILFNSCIEPAIKRHQGEVFRKLGDGILVAFPAAHEALSCALEIQRSCAARARELAALKLRSAIHAGEVVSWNGDLHGNAVNITARLQEFAAPGGIVVSDTIEALVRGKIGDEAMGDLGELALKGIDRRVRTYYLLERPAWFLARGRPSIAVLPFDESGSHEGGYFGDGIVEGIVNALAAVPELFVVSRSSTLAFRGGAADLREVRQRLGVQYVISGSIRPKGDGTWSITAEMSDSESFSVLCSKQISRRLDDIFDIQDHVSQQIVAMIGPPLRKAELSRIAAKRPENLNAYECFLRGLDLVYRLKRERFDRALEWFESAIGLDTRYAAPHAYSALWYAIRIGQGWSRDLAADRAKVREYADGAVERDDLDATSLALCGHVRSIQLREFDEAFSLFDRAIAASPNSAIVWQRSSPTCSYVGDWKEGYRRAEQGLRLSPLDRHLFYTHTALCLAAYTGQQYDDAVKWGRMAMSENPNFTANLRLLCAALAASGEIEDARQVAERLVAAEPDFRVEYFCSGYPYKERERRERFADHLRAAGLPS